MQDATTYKKPHAILKMHLGQFLTLIFNMLQAVKVLQSFIGYVESFYSLLPGIISAKTRETDSIQYLFVRSFPR